MTAEERKEYMKEYMKEYTKEYTKEKYKNDPVFRITSNLRSRLIISIKDNKKSDHSLNLIGCTPNELKRHIEKQFTIGMNWDNYGYYGWQIDHIIPCSSFDLSKPEEQKKCFHYTNLQPLWAEQNLSKSDKINYNIIGRIK
jgi:hypothetical protein